MRDIDTTLLRAFVTVIETGSFSRAARLLNRTQSTLSMQIKRLEDLVDTPLFDRGMRPPGLTPAGESLIAYAREIVTAIDAAIEGIRSEKIAGRIRLALMEDYATTCVVTAMDAFLERYPNVQLEIQTGSTGCLLEDLGTKYDLVVAMLPTGPQAAHFSSPRTDGKGGISIYSGKSVWAAASGFEPQAFDPLPLALCQPGCLFRRWAVEALDDARRRWRLTMTCSSNGTLAAAVQAGWCASVFKDNAVPAGLRVLSEADGLPRLPDFEVKLFQGPSSRSRTISQFADWLCERLRVDLSTANGFSVPQYDSAFGRLAAE